MSAPSEPFGDSGTAASGGVPGQAAEPPADPRTWARDLWLGARFAAGGGREGWTRTVLTAVGVGLGVALLLLAAAVPSMMDTRDHKRVARDSSSSGYLAHPTDRTLLVGDGSTAYHGKDVTGVLLKAEGPKAEAPPGVARIPAPGTMLVSPALGRLLASAPLLRGRLPHRIAGTIGQAGLLGPAELYYYAGSDALTARDAHFEHGNADRVSGFGHRSNSDVMGPTFDLLLVVMLVVLLLPVAVFVGTAVRLGGERRDRRLAALRLVGATRRATRRIAAGEALLGALLGLAFGAVFFLIGRQAAGHVTVRDISAFPSELRPGAALTVLIAVAVPVAAVAVTLVSLRSTVVEPLGVYRQGAGRRRRLWWRLLVPAAGLALLAPLFGTVRDGRPIDEYQVAAGAVMLLVGVTAVLPWLVEAAVGRLRGGPLAWQLATRRLQLNSSASARMVSGVTVAVAGAIALQMLFGAVASDFVSPTGADRGRAQAEISGSPGGSGGAARFARETSAVAATRGVEHAYAYTLAHATRPDANRRPGANDTFLPLTVGDCASLRQAARIGSCAPGGVFLVPPADGMGDADALRQYGRPGARIDLNVPPFGQAYKGAPRLWTIPASARTVPGRVDPDGDHVWGVLATPQAVGTALLDAPDTRIMVALDPAVPEAVEYLRNTAAAFGPDAQVREIARTRTDSSYRRLRRGLFVGAALTMALIGASLLVTVLEQLRERRKLLAVLVAFGTRRSALALSVLWQAAIPVLLGLVLACAGGLGLGAALLAMVGRPFRPDWGGVASMCAIGAGVVLAVTLLSLPPLWRLMRADGLHTE